MPDPDLEQGWVDAELAEEFPGLALWLTRVEAGLGPQPRQRARAPATGSPSRITGGHVIHMRQDPVPWAYRVFWRQVGIDPDTDRTPVEQLALDRLKWGGLRSRNLLDDAITIATLETGRAGDGVRRRQGRRARSACACTGEASGSGARAAPLSARQIVVADEDRALAVLSGEVAEERGVTPDTRAWCWPRSR